MPVKAINFTLFIPMWTTRLYIAAQLINIESLNQLLVSGGYRGAGGACPLLEAHVPTLPLQKSVESKAGNAIFKIPSF